MFSFYRLRHVYNWGNFTLFFQIERGKFISLYRHSTWNKAVTIDTDTSKWYFTYSISDDTLLFLADEGVNLSVNSDATVWSGTVVPANKHVILLSRKRRSDISGVKEEGQVRLAKQLMMVKTIDCSVPGGRLVRQQRRRFWFLRLSSTVIRLDFF